MQGFVLFPLAGSSGLTGCQFWEKKNRWDTVGFLLLHFFSILVLISFSPPSTFSPVCVIFRQNLLYVVTEEAFVLFSTVVS